MIDLPLNVDYSGKVVVITGAGGLICGAMARAFAQSGAKVAALDLNGDAVKKLADELKAEGFVCEGYAANVLDPEILESVHKQVLADLGSCDVLVCDGFAGNQVLKVSEGMAKRIITDIVKYAKKTGSEDCMKLVGHLVALYDFNSLGGGIILGTKKTVIKAHGAANEASIMNTAGMLLNLAKNKQVFEA